MAPPIDTRLGPGTLKLGTPLVDYGSQISNVRLEPSQDSEDGTPTLGNPDPLPELDESWVLTGEAVQDFEEPTGFVSYCFDHSLEEVPFEWVPSTPAGITYTGEVLLTAVPIGGDVSAQNTSEFEFAVSGVPVRDDAPGAVSGGRKAREARGKRRSAAKAGSSRAKRAEAAEE